MTEPLERAEAAGCEARGDDRVWVSRLGMPLPVGVWVQTCMVTGCPAMRIGGLEEYVEKSRARLLLDRLTARLRARDHG